MAKAPTNKFTVELQVRHAEWLRNASRSNREKPEQLLERIIRMAYAADHTKGGTVRGGGTVLAKDFNEG